MSFAATRIREYLKDVASKDQPLTEVRFVKTRFGGLDIVTISKDRRLTEGRDVSEEEIEQQLAKEGLIRMPLVSQQPAEEFRRIDVGGNPISEMIIEERR